MRRNWMILLLVGWLAAACVAPATPMPLAPVVEPTAAPTNEPATATPPPPTATPQLATAVPAVPTAPPQLEGSAAIAAKALDFAAQELSVNATQLQLVSMEEVEWRNSCLGVDKPGEMCLDVITPGYRIVLALPDGKQIAVHTNSGARWLRLTNP